MFLYLSTQFIDFGCPLYKFGMRHGKEDPSLFFVTDTSKHCSLSEPHSTSVAVQNCKSAYDVTLNDTDAHVTYICLVRSLETLSQRHKVASYPGSFPLTSTREERALWFRVSTFGAWNEAPVRLLNRITWLCDYLSNKISLELLAVHVVGKHCRGICIVCF